MKKVIASAGLVAVGAAGLQAAYAPGLSSLETSKSWMVSATVRGFYDDNSATAPDSAKGPTGSDLKQGSFGFELRPGFRLNLPMGDQTLLTADYTYSLKWYEHRDSAGESSTDQAHLFHLGLDHAFSEIFRVDLSDTFAISQEPDLIDNTATQHRANGSNVRNSAAVNFHAQVADNFEVVVGYNNNFYDYSQTAKTVGAQSYSGLLDRDEHLIILNLRARVMPETVAVFGYQYGIVGYSGNEQIGTVGGTPVFSKDRDNTSHYVYAGVDETFMPDLLGSLRAGAQYIQFDNSTLNNSQWSPYVDASLSYTYMQGCSASIGVRHTRVATDMASFSFGKDSITTDQDATTAYLNVRHQITPSLTAGAVGTVQWGSFNGGAANNKNETYYLAGVNLTYQINQYLSAETGYNFDKVSSDFAMREFTRNRVYIGLTAQY